jgi:polyisoprenoid-binding protein YceI
LLALGGPALSGTDTFNIDPGHSTVGFKVRHMVLTNVTGRFDAFEGVINYDAENIENSSVEVKIEAASINTNHEKRDGDLRGGEFLAADKHPEITFKSKKVIESEDGYVAVGDLTIRGVTKEVELPFTLAGPITSPWGQMVIGVEATLEINRQDYGVTWSKKLDNGGLVAGDQIKIELNIEAKKAQE